MPTDIPQWRKVDRRLFESEIRGEQSTKIVATAIRNIRRVLACHGIDLGKSADGVAAVR